MKTTYTILTLLALFISNAKAESNHIQMSLFDGACFEVDQDLDLGSIPSSDQSNYVAYQSFCDGYGNYKILKDGYDNNFVMSLDYRNSEIAINANEVLMYSENVAWVFAQNDTSKSNPIALVYSTYEEELIDPANNVWEPKESFTVVSLKGLQSCVVAEINEGFANGKQSEWDIALATSEMAASMKCLN